MELVGGHLVVREPPSTYHGIVSANCFGLWAGSYASMALVSLVWVIDPDRAEAHVHRPDGSISVLSKTDSLDGEDVLPGFGCLVSEILD